MRSKHVVTYKSSGVWTDNSGAKWGSGDSKEFSTEVTEAEFLAGRPDIEFMVGYGQMSIATVSIDDIPQVPQSDSPKPTVTVTPAVTITK